MQALQVVKLLGAAYLIFLGVRRLREQRVASVDRPAVAVTAGQLIRQGILVNLLNPKAALAFLPQFVDPTRGPIGLQILALGLVFTAMGFTSDSMYAIAAGSFRGWFAGRRGSIASAT